MGDQAAPDEHLLLLNCVEERLDHIAQFGLDCGFGDQAAPGEHKLLLNCVQEKPQPDYFPTIVGLIMSVVAFVVVAAEFVAAVAAVVVVDDYGAVAFVGVGAPSAVVAVVAFGERALVVVNCVGAAADVDEVLVKLAEAVVSFVRAIDKHLKH